eukprot:CAMPEP_0194060906 /NCGR_PEP_ID=MMETSP0009_2-20130614/73080_1 /TAXON_ID=210454 /ORGANISM="Grammatophora oceanica, Strain CCMP 410" /LENGTH=65 /DNA_ID=CAMNT_0038711983 /DNA_START=27 /DNA_END=221 /DNA_ORIENTATION=+
MAKRGREGAYVNSKSALGCSSHVSESSMTNGSDGHSVHATATTNASNIPTADDDDDDVPDFREKA